jgi:hypothetical protein
MIESDARIDTFLISLPEGWTEVDLDPDSVYASLRANEPETSSDAARLAHRRDALVARRLAQQARRGGLAWMSFMYHPVDEADAGIVVVAYLATESAANLDASVISFDSVRLAVEAEPDPPARRVEAPRTVDLSCGEVIRDSVIRPAHVDGIDEEISAVEVRYHCLIGSGEGMAVLGFVTPNVELVDDLVGLFDAIADTLEFVAA